MPNYHLATPEEEGFQNLLEVHQQVLSGLALTILREADTAAYAHNLASNYSFQPEEYEEAMRKMRLAAAKLTTQDRDLLAEIVRAAKAAAASIDPDDETPAGYGARRGDVHYHHSMAASMVEEILQEARE